MTAKQSPEYEPTVPVEVYTVFQDPNLDRFAGSQEIAVPDFSNPADEPDSTPKKRAESAPTPKEK